MDFKKLNEMFKDLTSEGIPTDLSKEVKIDVKKQINEHKKKITNTNDRRELPVPQQQ